MIRCVTRLAATVLAAVCAAAPAAARERFTTAAMNRITSVSNAVISPDGSRIAFVASDALLEKNEYRDRLFVYDLTRSSVHAVAGGHTSVNALAWSPDGTKLAAVLDDPTTKNDQLFVIDSANGAIKELTHGKTSVSTIAWNPRGEFLAFVRSDPAPVKTGAASYRDGFEVSDNAYLVTKAAEPDELWMVSLAGNETRLTSGPRSVADSPVSWSPDNRYLLYGSAPNGVYGIQDRAHTMRYDLATGKSAPLTRHGQYEDSALYSPDGTRVGFRYSRDGDFANETDAVAAGADGSGERDVSRALDRHVTTAAWMPDSRSFLLRINDATRAPLVVQPLHGPAKRLPMGEVVAANIDAQQSIARNGTIAFTGDRATRPDELYVLTSGAAAPRRLTHFNDWLGAIDFGKPVRVTWRGFDRFLEDGVLIYPPGYMKGRKYPLVLRIHGGPTEQSETGFDPFYQLAAARGYLVFAPNYRGSNGLGNAYERAVFNDASIGPGKDVMSGIDAVKRLGIVDARRIGISGWSYGGLLTSWLETQHTIWRAAVAGAAVNDLVVDYAIADDIDADAIGFTGGSPYKGNSLELWRRHSPITYFKNVRTPTLIMCNVYDVRVPIVESYEMFHALRDNNVPVEFYAYPTTGHLPRGPVRKADVYERWLGWFDKYLK